MSKSNYTAKYRMIKKQELIQYKGGKCEKCGYSKVEYPRVFSFHHTNPEEKDFSVSQHNYALDKLKMEVDKCIMLCQNCHAEEHDDPFIPKRKISLSAREKPQKLTAYCIICNTLLSKPKCKYCKEHKRELGRKVDRPSIEELSNLIKKYPLRQIAKKYMVVDNTIRKWLKFYKLPFKKKEIKEWYGLSGSNR